MKTKHISAVFILLALWLFASPSQAADITATGSGNWSSTNTDAPWPGGIVPGTNDSVDIEAPFMVSVDTNVTAAYIYGSGTVTMEPGTTLTVLGDALGAYGTQTLGTLNATAPSNTVIYACNVFHAKRTDYWNLVFTNATANLYDFYNGTIPGSGPVPLNVARDMTVTGKIKVQQGADITIGGNLIIGTNVTWDCSVANLTVMSNTVLNGLLLDLDGADGINSFLGNVTVNHSATGGWNLGDVITWWVGGSLTNNGLVAGIGYASISFNGTGTIAGGALKIPTLTINGTYTVGTAITLTTNTPTLNGTLVFDLANPRQIILPAYVGTSLYYSGALNVINSGAAPAPGSSYQFFNAPSYDGAFLSTSFPSLPNGLSWVDNTLSAGSISVSGALVGPPTLSLSRSGGVLTLSWDSTTYPGFSVQAQTNRGGLSTNWTPTGSGTISPFTITVGPTNPAVFFRLSNP